jgi:hypothetical protein
VALAPAPAGSAGWISDADSYALTWVNDGESELEKKEYRALFMNDLRAPQVSIRRLSDRAVVGYAAKDDAQTRQCVTEALKVIASGAQTHSYTQAGVQPIVSFIKRRVPVGIG